MADFTKQGQQGAAQPTNQVTDKDAQKSKAALLNDRAKDELFKLLSDLSVTLPTSPIIEHKKNFNVVTLVTGEYGGASIERDNTRVIGIGDARITRLLTVKADCTLTNLHFVSDENQRTRNNKDKLVKVQNTASCTFINCVFEKSFSDLQSNTIADEDAFIVVEAMSSASFLGCLFTGSVTGSGYTVLNRNVESGSAFIMGGMNKTGRDAYNTHVEFEMRNNGR